MTKFKVGDKVRVISNRNCSVNKVGEIGVVTEVTKVGARVHVEERNNFVNWHDFDEIELISPKQTKSQRIAALEAEVQRLHERLADLERKPSEDKAPEPALTPNEQRKAIIAEAKAFVAEYSGIVRNNTTPYTREAGDTRVKLFVNEKKRAVTAIPHLVHVDTHFPEDKAIAKAHPDDVFNADIGKAIALGRALGLDVTRFEKAVQPTEQVVGMRVKNDSKWAAGEVCTLVSGRRGGGKYAVIGSTFANSSRIIDDTEAKY